MNESKENGNSQKRSSKVGYFIIGNAIVWGAVMIITALIFRGTGFMSKLIPVLGGGAGFSVVILSSLLVGKEK